MPIDRVVALVGSAGALPVMKSVLERSHPNGRTTVFLCYHRAGQTQFDWRPYVDGYGAEPAKDGTLVRPDVVYHPDRSLSMYVADGKMRTLDSIERPRPNLDKLLTSLATEYGPRLHAFLLSGFGSDGVEGLAAVREAGGHAFVQHPDDAAFRMLPSRATALGLADHLLATQDIIAVGARLASGERIPALESPRG